MHRDGSISLPVFDLKLPLHRFPKNVGILVPRISATSCVVTHAQLKISHDVYSGCKSRMTVFFHEASVPGMKKKESDKLEAGTRPLEEVYGTPWTLS